MHTESTLTRRRTIAVLAAVFGGASAAPVLAQTSTTPKPALPVTPKPSFPKPTLHVYPDYGWLRGFNYLMPWVARIEDTWWFYDGRKIREDMALACSVHANAIRLWIDYSVWYRDPEKVTASFLDAIAAIDENLAEKYPEKVQEMKTLIENWMKQTGAKDLAANPAYDASRPLFNTRDEAIRMKGEAPNAKK